MYNFRFLLTFVVSIVAAIGFAEEVRPDAYWTFKLNEGDAKNGTITYGPWQFDAYKDTLTAANGCPGMRIGGQGTEVYTVENDFYPEVTLDLSLPVYDEEGIRHEITSFGTKNGRFNLNFANKTNIKHMICSKYAKSIPGIFQTASSQNGKTVPTLHTVTCESEVIEEIGRICFETCNNLKTLNFKTPKLTRFNDSAFYLTGLTNHIMAIAPTNAQMVGNLAFGGTKVWGDAYFTNLLYAPGSFASSKISSLTIISDNPSLTAGPSVWEIGATFTNLHLDMCNLKSYGPRTIGHRYSSAAKDFRTMYIGSSNVVSFNMSGSEGPLWGCANLNSFTFEGPFVGIDSLNHLFAMDTKYNTTNTHYLPRVIYCSKYWGWGDYVATNEYAKLTMEDKLTRGEVNGCPKGAFGVFVRTAKNNGSPILSRHAWLVHRESKWYPDRGGTLFMIK